MDKQQLEEILNNAPEGATHVSNYYLSRSDRNPWNKYLYYWYDRDRGMWFEASIDTGFSGCVRKLSDLQTQLDQLNEIERLKSVVTPEVVEFVRCGIGSNYGGKYYDEKIKSIYEPLAELLKEYNK